MNAFLRNAYRYFYIFTIFFIIIILVNVINGHDVDSQLYLCAGCGIVAMALHAWYYTGRRKALSDNTMPTLDTGETLELLEEALNALGCQPTTHRSDGKIIVAYQGENLLFDVRGNNVRIVDYVWRQVDRNDPDFSSKLMAVNYTNEAFLTKLFLWQLDNGNIGISTYLDFILYPGIKCLDMFLKIAMQSLLQSHRYLDETYLAMKSSNDRANDDTRRPVGFATTDENSNTGTNNNSNTEGRQPESNVTPADPNEVKAQSSTRRPIGFATTDEENIK